MILPRKNKGMSLLSLLVSIMLFSAICLIVGQWASWQGKSAVQLYQDFQALHIAKNQWQRKWLGEPCESTVQQNKLTFYIGCSSQQIIVQYPSGESRLDYP